MSQSSKGRLRVEESIRYGCILGQANPGPETLSPNLDDLASLTPWDLAWTLNSLDSLTLLLWVPKGLTLSRGPKCRVVNRNPVTLNPT